MLTLSLLALPHLSGTQTLPKDDPYTVFLKFVSGNVRYWNPDITRPEIEAYCWSTWEGCGEDLEKSKTYFCVCIQEQGMRNRDLFYTRWGGYGYSGASYRVIKRVCGGKTRRWVRRHPYLVNKMLCEWFCGVHIKADPIRWHNNPKTQNNLDYFDKVCRIRERCERVVPLMYADKR